MPLVLFFIIIAVTGIALQADMWLEGKSPPGAEKAPPSAPGYSVEVAQAGLSKAVATFSAVHPGEALSGFSMDRSGKIATLNLAKGTPRMIRIGVNSGAILPPLPPQEKGWHYILQDIHAGYFAGTVGRIVSTLAGLGMLLLSLTGLFVYLNLFRRRFRMGRKNPFWR